ncbi:hypothetical protein GALMADRAFT_137753 [Galerina marginata CBS 339.88]|uniref:Protein kinase domain-containing protein n=1 Tax=Galerina marginata (strain CBS 339.88) TaxID=685588 RepID=A0A067TFP8_GALM3|nr:hypothetical protein GALMADRAFT_137753 [Galerina marginata CBS 339.88]
MSTLQLIFDGINSWDLCCWDRQYLHQSAQISSQLSDNVYVVKLGPVAEKPTSKVVAKIARGATQVLALEAEYSFYRGRLAHLQGTVIPECRGFFMGMVDGEHVRCLLLEHCCPNPKKPATDPEEFHRRLMVGICKIHQAGVQHTNLLRQTHIAVHSDGSPRILDFSLATQHQCDNMIPADSNGRLRPGRCCPELTQLELFYGLKSGEPPKFQAPRLSVINRSTNWR